MYTLVRDGDGSITYRTRKSPAEMSPEQARRALSGLLPLTQELLDAIYPEGRPEAAGAEGETLVIPELEPSSRSRP